MAVQKQAVLELVETHHREGRTVSEVLGSVGVARSSYYRWKKGEGEKKVERSSRYELTGEERQLIEEVKQITPAVSPSAHPGDVATAGSVFVSISDLRASKRAGRGRAL